MKYNNSISCGKNLSIIFRKLRELTSSLDLDEGVTTNMHSYKVQDSFSETIDNIFSILEEIKVRKESTLVIRKYRYTSMTEIIDYIFFLIRQFTTVNPLPPSGEYITFKGKADPLTFKGQSEYLTFKNP